MANMEAMKKGFINSAKNFFFYVTVLAITCAGSYILFPKAGEIIVGLTGEYLDSGLLMTINVGALIAVCIGIFIIAKKVWSKTDCSVTNATLFIAPVGPIAFLTLIGVGTGLVMLVIAVVSFVLAILAVIFAGICVFGMLSGG